MDDTDDDFECGAGDAYAPSAADYSKAFGLLVRCPDQCMLVRRLASMGSRDVAFFGGCCGRVRYASAVARHLASYTPAEGRSKYAEARANLKAARRTMLRGVTLKDLQASGELRESAAHHAAQPIMKLLGADVESASAVKLTPIAMAAAMCDTEDKLANLLQLAAVLYRGGFIRGNCNIGLGDFRAGGRYGYCRKFDFRVLPIADIAAFRLPCFAICRRHVLQELQQAYGAAAAASGDDNEGGTETETETDSPEF